MQSLETKIHDKFAAGLADQRVSPAILALKMVRENRAVNEALLGYMINYIIIMAESPLIPFQLQEVKQMCQTLKISLEELGLTGKIQREPVATNEYISV